MTQYALLDASPLMAWAEAAIENVASNDLTAQLEYMQRIFGSNAQFATTELVIGELQRSTDPRLAQQKALLAAFIGENRVSVDGNPALISVESAPKRRSSLLPWVEHA